MKRIILVAGVALCMMSAVVLIAQTDVTSVNAVGFVRNTFATGSWTMVQIPFDEMQTGQYCITNVFGDTFPDGTVVWFWNRWTQQWKQESYGYNFFLGKNVWTPGTNVLESGNGVFVNIPSGAPQASYTVSFSGEVPATNSTPVYLRAGFTLLGYPYPASMRLTNTAFGASAKEGDTIWAWNTQQGTWQQESYGYNFFLGKYVWTPGTMVLQPGMAFFYQSASSATNSETKPYVWP